MEILISIVASMAGEAAGSCLASSCSAMIKSTVQFDAGEWENATKNLFDLRDYVQRQVDSAELDGRSPAKGVKRWLREVGELEEEANSVGAGLMAAENRPNLSGRLAGRRLRLKAMRVLEKVDLLFKAGAFPAGLLSENCLARAVEFMAGPSVEDQATASRVLAELMERLNDDAIHRIGVWGMAGVGKTTLVKNLNNKLDSSDSLRRPFSCVIWATVSKDLDVKRVQLQMCKRLNLEAKMEESVERTARQLCQRLEKEERFLLILDDMWESVDLDLLGVPTGSKVLLTSRFFSVCQDMMTDVEVKVESLSHEEAWRLFSEKAGEVVSLEHVKPFAEAVARECCGLPLALITVGTSMRRKDKVELWKHALKELQRSAPCIRGVKDKVYRPLKLSYDSLEELERGDKIRACFLYCALFPEDYSIEVEELVWYWVAEGLIDEQQSFEDSENNAISLLETLKDCCLLEKGDWEGTVKMHDVVRDVAIWIGSSLQDSFRSLVRSGMGLSEVSVLDLTDSLGRVSFMNNKINKLPDCETHCEKASTLLLQGNFPLEDVPEKFLQGFKSLRVMNLGRTRIHSLPPLLQLIDLRALLLGNCIILKELPSLERLIRLQVLNLSSTRMRELPKHMANLINLRQVNLSYTDCLEKIEAGIVSKWTQLEVFDVKCSAYHWGVRGEVEEGQTSLEELRCLERLFSLSISLKSIQCIGLGDLTWITKLKRFQFFVGPKVIPSVKGFKSSRFPLLTRLEERQVAFNRLDLSGEWIGWLLVSATSLVLDGCRGVDGTLQNLAISSVFPNGDGFGTFTGLKSLTITNTKTSFRPGGGCAAPCDLLPNLEALSLVSVHCIESVSELVGHLGLLFSKLKIIQVTNCPKMKYLLSYASFMLTLPNLETIVVSHCHRLEKLFSCFSEQTTGSCPVVPNLRILELRELNRLESLCGPEEHWPSLECINVEACDSLKKLPLTAENANSMKEIRGESDWWSRLEWRDDETKTAMQRYFAPWGFLFNFPRPTKTFV